MTKARAQRAQDIEVASLRTEFDAYVLHSKEHREFEVATLGRISETVGKLAESHDEVRLWQSDMNGSLKVLKWLVMVAPPVLVSVVVGVWWVAMAWANK